MIFRRKKHVGIDLGSRKAKIVSLAKSGNEVMLVDIALFDHKLENSGSALGSQDPEFLKSLVEGMGLEGSYAASSLEDGEVQQMTVHLPRLTDEEVHSAIQAKIEAKVGEEIQQYSFDYQKLSNRKGDPEETYLVYFTKLEKIHDEVKLFELAKLKPVAIESNLHSILESLRFNGYVSENETNVIVDIGDSHISIGLVNRGDLLNLNVIRNGIGEINNILVREYQVSFEQAEELKRSYSLDHTESDPSEDPMKQVLEDGYSKIVIALHDSITFLKAAYKDQVINSIYLVGGGANKEGLVPILEESLNIPVVVANALKNIQIFTHSKHNPEKLAAAAAELHPAVGLALRGVS